eukprot:COSAG02_NODE_25276_length_663_cov_1.171986_1_plen_57_part_01
MHSVRYLTNRRLYAVPYGCARIVRDPVHRMRACVRASAARMQARAPCVRDGARDDNG